MHNIIILAAVLLPLIGVMRVEMGAFGNSIGMHGYPNGVSVVYALYAAVLISAYFVLRQGNMRSYVIPVRSKSHFTVYATFLAFLFLFFLLLSLFGFGGSEVWVGNVNKGEFRANLGLLGAPAYLLINSVIPMLMAYAAVLYSYTIVGFRDRGMLTILFVLTLLIGSTWGFKSTGITMLVPALILLYWDARIGRILLVCGAILLVITFFFYLFDSKTTEAAIGVEFLMTRLTTLQGDVSWLFWNKYINGETFPSYWKTLQVFVGDRIFSALSGITPDMSDLWAEYHFDILVNQLSSHQSDIYIKGHSVVGTPFVDGVVVWGLPGVLMIALFLGLLCGVVCILIEHSFRRGQAKLCAFLATYFGIFVTTFLRNGSAVQLIHIATFGGLLVALALCILLDKLALMYCAKLSQIQKSQKL